MKNTLLNVLSYPLTQVLSFCIILVGSPYFGGPYLFFVYGSFKEAFAYGILGMLGIAVTLVSLFAPVRGYMQVAGNMLMILSLAIFFFSSTWTNAAVTLYSIPALMTLLLFVLISIVVAYRRLAGRA